MDIKEDYNLRENADITYLAMQCAESKDPTELKKWFDAKYNSTEIVNEMNSNKPRIGDYVKSIIDVEKPTPKQMQETYSYLMALEKYTLELEKTMRINIMKKV